MLPQTPNVNTQPERYAAGLVILDFTQRMLAHARTNDWDVVSTLYAERQKHVTDYFLKPVLAGDSPWVEEMIKSMLDSDKVIIELGQANRSLLTEQLAGFIHGRQVTRTYEGNSK